MTTRLMQGPILFLSSSVCLVSQSARPDIQMLKDVHAAYFYSAYFTSQGGEKETRDSVYRSLVNGGFTMSKIGDRFYLKSNRAKFPIVVLKSAENHLKIEDYIDELPKGESSLVLDGAGPLIRRGTLDNFKTNFPAEFALLRRMILKKIADNFKFNSGVIWVSPINKVFPEFLVLFHSKTEKALLRFSLDDGDDRGGFINVLPYSESVARFVRTHHIEEIPLSARRNCDD